MTDSEVNKPAGLDPAPQKPAGETAPPNGAGGHIRLALALLVMGLALVGQFNFSLTQMNTYDGLLFFAAAVAVFGLVGWWSESNPKLAELPVVRWAQQGWRLARDHPVRTVVLFISLAVAYTAIRYIRIKPNDTSFWDIFVLWVISSVGYVGAWCVWRRWDVRGWYRTYAREIWVVAAVTLIAAGLRFWALGALPDVVSGDEGGLGNIAVAVQRGQIHNMFSTLTNQGGIYMSLMAACLNIFGRNALGLRILAAVGGTLSVPGIYLLARRMFNPRVALLAMVLLAVSHIHLHFSRIIVTSAIQDVLLAVLTFYFLQTGLEKRRPLSFVLCGAVMGLHYNVYMGAKLVTLLMLAYLVVLWFLDRPTVRANLANLLALAGALVVVAGPIVSWGLMNPSEFFSRTNQMVITQNNWLNEQLAATGRSAASILLELVGQTLLSLNHYPAEMHYGSLYPMLDYVASAMAVLGLAYTLLHLRNRNCLLLQGWFWSSIVTGALVVGPAPAVYRILLILPALCILAALSVDRLLALSNLTHSRVDQWVQWGVAGAFIVSVSYFNLKAYFPDFAMTCRFSDDGTRFASFMGKQLNTVGPSYKAYLFGGPNMLYGIHPSVDYLSGNMPLVDVLSTQLADGQPSFLGSDNQPVILPSAPPAIFFFLPERENEVTLVQQVLPGGTVQRRYDCGTLRIVIYQVDVPAP